jgi:hypothetical protein
MHIRFYEILRLSVFFPSCDFHDVYEFSRLSVFFPSCDLRDIFYRMHGYSTNSNLSQYPRKSKKIF